MNGCFHKFVNFFELVNQVTGCYTFLDDALNLESLKYAKYACKKERSVYHFLGTR